MKQCSICLSEIKENKNVCITECMHEYHTSCLLKWLVNNETCPICRNTLIFKKQTSDIRYYDILDRMSDEF